jgi:putative transposase
MSRRRFDLTVGAQLWFEGALWHVQRIDAQGVELANGRSPIRVSVAKLYSCASLVVVPEVSDTEEELVAVVLGSLTRDQRQALEERAKHVREVIAASGEGGAKTATEAYKKKSDELGVSGVSPMGWWGFGG